MQKCKNAKMQKCKNAKWPKLISIISLASAALLLSACSDSKSPTKENLSKAVQEYLDTRHAYCFMVFDLRDIANPEPFTVAKGDNFRESYDFFTELGLLSATEIKAEPSAGKRPGTHSRIRYEVTEKGRGFLGKDQNRGGQAAFCTGKLEITEVVNYTEPRDLLGMHVTQVSYRAKAKDVADWAQKIIKNQTEIEEKAPLVLTNEGWIHEKLWKK